MAHPVFPPTQRNCSSAVPSRTGRPRADGIVIRSTCPHPAARGVFVPFGRDDDARKVAWDLTAGRNLLVLGCGRESTPLLPMFLTTAKALDSSSHDVSVVDPHGRYGWVDRCADSASRRVHRATRRENIPRLLAGLADGPADRRRLLIVAGLRAAVDLLAPDDREVLARLVASGSHRNLTVVASSTASDSHRIPGELVASFDDVITPTLRTS